MAANVILLLRARFAPLGRHMSSLAADDHTMLAGGDIAHACLVHVYYHMWSRSKHVEQQPLRPPKIDSDLAETGTTSQSDGG